MSNHAPAAFPLELEPPTPLPRPAPYRPIPSPIPQFSTEPAAPLTPSLVIRENWN